MGECRNTAIVLAAGQGKRMHSKIQKQFMELDGMPVLCYSLRCFQESPLIRDVILVTGEEYVFWCKEEIVEKYGFTKVSAVVSGGKERYDSVYEGLRACKDTEYVLIHDGARPFIDHGIIERGLMAAAQTGASVTGMPSKDTVKIADEDGNVSETPDRSSVWIVQTPQIFQYPLIYGAYTSIRQKEMTGITDDAMVAEHEAGESKWSAGTLISYAFRNIVAFTTLPLQFVTAGAVGCFGCSLLLLVYSLVRYFSGHAVEGYTTLLIVMLFIGSAVMMSLGIIGYYIARIYEEVKRRPRYIVSKIIRGGDTNEKVDP